MAPAPRILALNSSLRADSWNYKLVKIAGQGAEQAGAVVTYLHLNELPMPVFDEDLEAKEGIHPNAKKFKELLLNHDGLLIASAENNGSISSALKNVLDWASRSEADEQPLSCYKNKTALIVAASPGGLGGLRGLVHLRAILSMLGVTVLPDQRAVGGIHKQFNADGQMQDEKLQASIEALGAKLAQVCAKLIS